MHKIWRRRLRDYVVVGGLLALLVSFFAFPGSPAAADGKRGDESLFTCKRASLTRSPLWTGSGAWNGEDLVLVDTIRRRLLPFSEDGRARPEPRGPLQKALTDLYPIRIAAGSDGGLVLQADANRFLVLDRGFATLGNVSTRLLATQDGTTIEKVFDWALAGNDIVGFADVKTPGLNGNENDRWASGVVRFSTGKASGFEFLENLDVANDISRKYHRLGNAYIANLGDTAYYLLMGNGIHLWRHQKGKSRGEDLGDLEGSFPLWKISPPLPSFVNPQDYSEVMETVELSSMPTGLYGWVDPVSKRQALYLVSRQRQNGKTQWLMSKLDPRNGRVQGTASIASNANHLFIVPGASRWAVVEKGPALGLQEQEVKGIYTIPAEKIRKSFQPGRSTVLDLCQ